MPGAASDTEDGFSDVAQAGFHAPAVEILDQMGIFDGTECETARFCPGDPMRRWVMTVWISRALGLEDPPVGGSGVFSDVGYVWWAGHAEALAERGITRGCGLGSDRYCPYAPVTRGQMASFLVATFDLHPAADGVFTDIEGNVHAANVEALARADITSGCATDPDRYCPDEPVTRGQMATFLARALGVVPSARFSEVVAERSVGHLVSSFTTYHRCCENRVINIHLFVDKLDGTVIPPSGRFSLNRHVGRRSEADGFLGAGTIVDGEVVATVGGGVSQVATTLYNAMFWGGYRPITHRPHSFYISRYPEGIEATINWPDLDLVFRNDTSGYLLIVADYTATSLTVQFFGDNDGRIVVGEWKGGEGSTAILSEGGERARVVTASVSERYDHRAPREPLVRTDDELGYDEQRVVQTAQEGWTVRVTRTVEALGARSVRNWTVWYAPRRQIVEVHPCTPLADSCPVSYDASVVP